MIYRWMDDYIYEYADGCIYMANGTIKIVINV